MPGYINAPIVEKRLEHKGLPCVVLFNSPGYRNGYVGVPIGTEMNTSKVNCHGGIVAVLPNLPGQNDEEFWWIGFSCCHKGDGYDFEEAKKKYALNPGEMNAIKWMEASYKNKRNKPKTLAFCETECIRIAEQVKEAINEQKRTDAENADKETGDN